MQSKCKTPSASSWFIPDCIKVALPLFVCFKGVIPDLYWWQIEQKTYPIKPDKNKIEKNQASSIVKTEIFLVMKRLELYQVTVVSLIKSLYRFVTIDIIMNVRKIRTKKNTSITFQCFFPLLCMLSSLSQTCLKYFQMLVIQNWS